MQTMLQNNSRAVDHLNNTALMRGITAGLICGRAGTIGSHSQSNGTGVKVGPDRQRSDHNEQQEI
jgi:hypothetical protein